jgi:tRNA/rRNA methyltransferase
VKAGACAGDEVGKTKGAMEPPDPDSIGADGADISDGAAIATATATATVQRLVRTRFVLVEPSHPGNIGASARAMASMGFSSMVVVRPRDPHFRTAPEAIALAAGAQDLLAGARTAESLPEALEGVQLALATTGYARERGPQQLEVRAAAQRAAQAVQSPESQVAFVFGPERTGLSNADVQRCHLACHIPADPVRGSLNLAQAVQVVAYECRREMLAGLQSLDHAAPRRDASRPEPRASEPAAGVEQTEAMFEHLEQALVAVGYLDPQQPKHLMARVRRLLLRAQPSAVEVDILRGIAAAMIVPRKLRAGNKSRRDTSPHPNPLPPRGRGPG